MIDLTIDFESYFDTEVSMRKLATLEYARHPKFKVFGAGVKIGSDPAQWLTGADLADFFAAQDWANTRVISHNSNFDLVVLHEKYGAHPGDRVDTLGLCRALLPHDLDFGLDAIAPRLGFEPKVGGGAALDAVKGVEHPTAEQLDALGEYAIGDVDNCYGIYTVLYPHLPENERRFMNLVLRISTQGVFEASPEALAALHAAREEIEADRASKLDKVPYSPTQLRSRDQFAEILRKHGVEPPMKISPTTNQPTYAFARQDPDYIALRAHPEVGDIVEARMAVASNNAITRIGRLVNILQLAPYTLPVQLNVSGAHTHRLSGGGKINSQNLNARGIGSSLRQGLRVRDDYVVMVYDLSGIELRMNMWFSGQHDVVETIRNGGDVYVQEAAAQFRVPEAQVTDMQRFFGKVVRLGAQYGMGAPKFRTFVAAGPLGMPPRYLTELEAYNTIMTYRANHPAVTGTWRWLTDIALRHMTNKNAAPLVRGPVSFEYERAVLPGGLAINYPNLTATEDGWTWGMGKTHYIWGGTLLENLTQALAGALVKAQMLEIDARLDGDTFTRIYQRPQLAGDHDEALVRDVYDQLAGKAAVIHQVHDEILIACRAEDAEDLAKEVETIMTRTPDWAPGLPLEVEGGWAQEYS